MVFELRVRTDIQTYTHALPSSSTHEERGTPEVDSVEVDKLKPREDVIYTQLSTSLHQAHTLSNVQSTLCLRQRVVMTSSYFTFLNFEKKIRINIFITIQYIKHFYLTPP